MGKSLIAGLILFALSTTALAAGQGVFLFNTSETGSADTAVTATVAALADQRAHVYGVDAWCSAGTATLSITDGGTTIWTSKSGEVGTSAFRAAWPVGLTGSSNSAVVVTLSTCGGGNTGTLTVQADRF